MSPVFDMANAEKNFARAMDELAKLPGFDRRKIVLAEAGTILKTCAIRTKSAPVEKINRGAQLRALKSLKLTGRGDVTVNAGIKGPLGRVFIKKKGGSGYRRTHDEGFKPLNQHYTNMVWSKLANTVSDAQQIIAKVAVQARQSAGLARQSWLLIAESLGIDLARVPGRGLSGKDLSEAKSARARNGKLYANGMAREEISAQKYFVTLINRLPYGRRIGLDRTLQATIAGRVAYIQQTFAKATFESMSEIAKRFPGWKVTGGI